MALATLKYFPFYYKFDIEYEQISCTEVNEPSDSLQQAQRRKKNLMSPYITTMSHIDYRKLPCNQFAPYLLSIYIKYSGYHLQIMCMIDRFVSCFGRWTTELE